MYYEVKSVGINWERRPVMGSVGVWEWCREDVRKVEECNGQNFRGEAVISSRGSRGWKGWWMGQSCDKTCCPDGSEVRPNTPSPGGELRESLGANALR